MSKERRNLYTGKRGPNGRQLCRWCGTETKPPRRTFCGDACVHEWLLRTDARYLRNAVRERDKGICASCGCDCYRLRRIIRLIARDRTVPWQFARSEAAAILKDLGFGNVRDLEKSYWEADHIESVVEGGGECSISNIQTLCRACHLEKTRELAKRRAAARRLKDPE